MSRKMKNFDELNATATAILKEAMFNERSKRFKMVVNDYRRLLTTIDLRNLARDYEPPSGYKLLLYELHYHLGMALQHIGDHRRAIQHYTKAINSITRLKGGCLAGCHTNSCLMTPLHTRRSFAYARTGDLRNSLKDAERAVVLDSRNPDVYCVRALSRHTRREETEAIKDCKLALGINPSHVCALLLLGNFEKPLSAYSINPTSKYYMDVRDFNHPSMMDFYDRFLYSLNVPHTISQINMIPDKVMDQIKMAQQLHNGEPIVFDIPIKPNRAASSADEPRLIKPFRAGTPTSQRDKDSAPRRRKEYGESVRKYMAKPRTAKEYIDQLVKHYNKQHKLRREAEENERELERPMKTNHNDNKTITESHQRRPKSCPGSLEKHEYLSKSHSPVAREVSDLGRRQKVPESEKVRNATETIWRERVHPATTPIMIRLDSVDTGGPSIAPVFQKVNTKNFPRMYYRPWRGDKLPMAELERKPNILAFY
ncbi:unnamed protein product [Owenia fusiformis]|uniref:Uncharacterized protein n=1 Tax=Owenia fusiformis TaxID=6347 RepID=A0A8J1T6S6_OWEFU|nr:unnamed protein product [Owenia fusiformis]